jgi:hypothetical protein
MRNITIRLVVTVLAFVIGTLTTFWVRPHPTPTQMDRVVALPAAPLKEGVSNCDPSTPEIKWIFINCSPQEAQGWFAARVVIFYDYGDWVRVGDTVSRKGTEFVFSTSEGYGAEVGKWTVNQDGSFTVVIETLQDHLWMVRAYPHTETWLIGASQAFLTKQAGLPRPRVATRFLQIGDTQLVNGAREDGQSPLAIKRLFDPCRIRRAESVAID